MDLRRSLTILVFVLVASSPAFGLELVIPFEAEPLDEASLPTGMVIPARSSPSRPAQAGAWRIRWDEYQTLVVIGEVPGSKPLRSPAWIVTYDAEGAVAVAYRATAYRDQAGLTHIDARRAIIAGPMHDDWSPDSFALAPDGTVYAIDDMNRANTGSVMEQVEPTQVEAFRHLLSIVMATVRETS